jgi:hypothetical protein
MSALIIAYLQNVKPKMFTFSNAISLLAIKGTY